MMGEPTSLGPFVLMPVFFIGAGLAFVAWLMRWHQLPDELEPHVLAALSDTEALPNWEILRRSPLAERDVDAGTLEYVLERLRGKGMVVRWYEQARRAGQPPYAVYRRVSRPVAEHRANQS